MSRGVDSGPTPDERVAQAAGSFSEAVLTSTDRLIDQRVVDYLSPTEHLEYLLWHQYKGLRLIHPDGSEETPHHDATTSGNRFLLVTDRRLCYLAGLDSHDEQQTFTYDQLTDVESTSNIFTQWLTFTDADGVQYRFAETGTHADDVEPAADYIQTRIDDASSAQSDQRRDDSTPGRSDQPSDDSPSGQSDQPSDDSTPDHSDQHTDDAPAGQTDDDVTRSQSIPPSELERELVTLTRGAQRLHDTIKETQQDIIQLHDEIESLQAAFEEAETLADDGAFGEAEHRLTDLDSRLTTARETAIQYGLDDVQTEVRRLEQQRQDRLSELDEQQRRYQPLRDEVKSIRSSLDHAERLIDTGDLETARDRLTDLDADISKARDAATQYQFDGLEDELTALDQRCEDRLETVTDRLE